MRAWLLIPLLLFPSALLADGSTVQISTITVHGDAVTKLSPDQVTLPVTVRVEAGDLKTAKQRHDDKLRALLALAESSGIAKNKIETDYTSVSPEYDYQKDSTRPHLRGYQVQTSLRFALTDFSKLGDFMNGVINAGIDNTGSVSYSLQDETKARDETLLKALNHAYTKAVRLAETAKMTLGNPLTINEGDIEINRPQPPRPMMRMMAKSADEPAPELPEGQIEIRESVTVTYQLK